MKLTKRQFDLLNRRNIVVLATSNLQGKPRAIFVEVNQIKNDNLIIADNEMMTTKKNLLENKQVALLAFEENYSFCLKILGEAEYYSEGKYFNLVKNLETNKNRSPKGTVVVTIKEIIEFN